MTYLDGDALVREHLDGNPNMRHAALHDAEFAADLHRLRTILGHVDKRLSIEDLPEETRRRVAAGLVGDLLGTDEAEARMEERARKAAEIMETRVPRPPLPW